MNMAKIGREYQHIEDLVLVSASRGFQEAANIMNEIASGSLAISAKWDGKSVIYFGRDKDGFGFGDKYTKIPLRTANEVREHLLARNGCTTFAEEMSGLFERLHDSYPDIEGYIEAGLMSDNSKKGVNYQGNAYLTPNTVSYKIPGLVVPESGYVIAASSYRKDLTSSRTNIPQDITEKWRPNQVAVIWPLLCRVNVSLVQAHSLDYGLIDLFLMPEVGMNNINECLYRFINHDPDMDVNVLSRFRNWVEKDDRFSVQKKEKICMRLDKIPGGFYETMRAMQILTRNKHMIIEYADQSLIKQGYGFEIAGKTASEGYVLDIDYPDTPLKLVNRHVFTKYNKR